MEVQGLQEALKVELQCHQSQSLCKGLNELQNGQLSVRTCPVGTNKPLSLIKPSSQSIAISVVPAKTPVSMVTAHINGQKAGSSESLQTSPINLQTGGRVTATTATVHAFNSSRRVGELSATQMLGTLTAVPIKVPQVSSLHQLEGQAATLLPQVRPKTQIPDSLPHSPCQELQPLRLQRATAVVSPKSQGATLPTSNSTFNTDHQPNGQSENSAPVSTHGPTGGVSSGNLVQHASAGQGVAYAIIAASPTSGNGVSAVSEAVKVQPLLFSADNKVIIIQPQTPSSSEVSPSVQADLPSQEAPPTPKSPTKKKDEDPEKMAFMVALGLVTTEHMEEIQQKRQERKRRSTANPAYSGLFEPERKRLPSYYLNSSLFLSAQDTEDLCWKEEVEHDDHCAVCKEDGELQPCHNCPRAFHPNCLYPPLKTPPRGAWYCPKCQKKVLNKENMSWPQNFVQSYVTHKTVRQEERRRLMRRNNELKKARAHLEEQDRELNQTIKKCQDVQDHLLGQQRDTQSSLERLKALIRLIQRDQLIQVTMTTTATISTAAAALLSKTTSTNAIISTVPGVLTTPPQMSHTHSQDTVNN
ncbi:PHD finger protein 21B isoform X2 [Cynoglossus semilaevis]|uniref:PHD finger protein 21B isoform X2 n=1 Tax=Cynoglossus semilaevis TaxID=244447 RepID=UPI000497D006|nr:PHD finger protein 21B isoform X2 [Cynoglossus semilaevis]